MGLALSERSESKGCRAATCSGRLQPSQRRRSSCVKRTPLSALRSPRMPERWNACGARPPPRVNRSSSKAAPSSAWTRRSATSPRATCSSTARRSSASGDQVKAPPQAQVIDATNTIIIPGFVDAHRHSWEGQLRRIIPDGAIAEYMATTHNGFARYYRPHDIYVGNLITALGLHRRRHHLRDRQLAQLALGRALRCGGAGAHRFGHSRRPRLGRAADRRVGPAVAAGSRTAAEAVLLVDRSTGHVADVLRDEPRELGAGTPARSSESRPSRTQPGRSSRSSGTRSCSAPTTPSTTVRDGPTRCGSASRTPGRR